MRHFLIWILLVINFLLANSQTSIGFELNINKDFSELRDQGNEIGQTPRINVSAGPVFRHQYENKITVYSGIILKHFKESMAFKSFNSYSSGTGNMVLQVPLVLGYRIPLVKDFVFFSPLLGGCYNYMLTYHGGSFGSSSMANFTDSIKSSYEIQNLQQHYITVTAGLMLEFKIARNLTAAYSFQYYHGFTPISNELINYRRNADPVNSAVQTNYGTYVSFMSLKIFYNFYKKKEAQ